ncbi:methyltransferase domain-containing protein [Candidatus Gracilibacteria bacterium]|nr:methyltransferase domain-containing protein [Candidatus Gracilibacteria bacterium]
MEVIYPRNFSPSRNKIILDYCKGKKVLHVGACDAPFTQGKLDGKYGPLLYKDIDNVCLEQIGIDLDKESIELLNSKSEFKKSKVIFFDMNKLEELDFKPDIIIFGEVIEHLMNLEIALTNLKKVMNENTILIISTPNAFYLTAFINSIFGVERFHEDHKVLFSYGYLKNLLNFNGIDIINGYFTTLDWWGTGEIEKLNIYGKVRFIIEFILKKIMKFNSDTLLIITKKGKQF